MPRILNFLTERQWTAVGILGWIGIAVLSVVPAASRPHSGFSGVSEHFWAYALVALCFGLGTGKRGYVAIPVFLVSGSAILELVQISIPGRTSELAGVISAAAGVTVGMVLAVLLRRWLNPNP